MSGFTRATPVPKKWKLVTSSHTAKSGELLLLNAPASSIITLPAAPKESDEIWMVQISTAAVIVNINFSGQNFQSAVASGIQYNNLKLDGLIYVNASIGWVSVNRLIS